MDLEDLAKKVESLEGSNTEVNWLIAETFGEIPEHSIREVGFEYEWFRRSSNFSLIRAKDSEGRSIETWTPEDRTGSFESAMRLVPSQIVPGLRKGTWWWNIEHWPYESIALVSYENGDSGVIEESGKAFTPTLALTAAALRAHQTVRGFDD